jgi:sporulation protein YlmC with PRC-barrel domain
MKKIMILIAIISALGVLAAFSYAGLTGGQTAHSSMPAVHGSIKTREAPFQYRASTIIGRWVKNKEGEYLGRITDLMIDPQNGGKAFAVLSRGGVLGIPLRFVAVPFQALASSDEKHVYLLDVSKEKIDAAPSFDRDHWPDVADRGWETDTYRYYGLTPHWGESGGPVAPLQGKAARYRQIVGMSVKNQQGEELGKINDVVIDSQGHVPLAILAHGGFWGMGEKLFAVPFRALSFEPKGKDFVLNSTKEKLDSAPAFKMSDLSHENLSPKKRPDDLYQFFGQPPSGT